MNYRQALGIAYPLRDPVESDLNRYLAKQDRDDQRQQAIEDRANELLENEYNPFIPENVWEALGECSKDELAGVALGLMGKSYEKVGINLRELVLNYWHKVAKDKAEFDVDNCGDV